MTKLKDHIKDFMTKFQEDNVPLLAAAQAYYYLLSIVPLLIVCFALIPYFHINPNDASFMENALPGEIASIFKENIVSLVETPRHDLLTIGIIGALWSASARKVLHRICKGIRHTGHRSVRCCHTTW